MQDGNKWWTTSCQSTVLCVAPDFMVPAQTAVGGCCSAKTDVPPPTREVKPFFAQAHVFETKETKLTSHGYITILHPQWDFIHNLFTPIDQNIFFSVLIWLYVQCWCNRPAIYWVLTERVKERAAGLHDNIFERSRNKTANRVDSGIATPLLPAELHHAVVTPPFFFCYSLLLWSAAFRGDQNPWLLHV